MPEVPDMRDTADGNALRATRRRDSDAEWTSRGPSGVRRGMLPDVHGQALPHAAHAVSAVQAVSAAHAAQAAHAAHTAQAARPVVGRFAPTPSGRMHLGNAYAMLAAWLSARAAGLDGRGSCMILRIEDIDAPRVVKDADRWIMDDLDWLGLDWDGEPVYQSGRLDRYEEAFRALRDAGDCYPCFCSRADIRAASAPNEGDGFVVYPGTCRRLWRDRRAEAQARVDEGLRHSWRFAVTRVGGDGAGDTGAGGTAGGPDGIGMDGGVPVVSGGARAMSGGATVAFDDVVFGPQRFDLAREVGDTVIRRSDGLFAYQLVVTVDDLDMGVTDVVRGRDLLRSTAVQLAIRERLCAAATGAGHAAADPEPPRFAHLPLVDNAQGRRLAKREHDLDLGYLRRQGVHAEQVIGYCAWMLGLQGEASGPVSGDAPAVAPMTASEALAAFRERGWAPLRAHRADRRVPDDCSGTLTATL